MTDQLAIATIILGAILWFIGLFGSDKGAPGWPFKWLGLLAILGGGAWWVCGA